VKIKRLRLEHFRCWKDQTINLDDYTCFVGANGAGKSAVLCALNLFFRHTQNSPTDVLNLHAEDFYQKDTSLPIKITVTFSDLSTPAQTDFKAYYRQGELSVMTEARWDNAAQIAIGRHYGSRKVMTAFFPFFTADDQGKRVAELRDIYKTIRKSFPNLAPPGTHDAMRDALREYEESHPEDCDLSPSENQFYGWTKGANLLEKYIQWVYIPAVKDASDEQFENKTSAFGQLLERTIRQKVDFALLC
jgi:energy-coupling factor transporter ATP-binding protein EcfA2